MKVERRKPTQAEWAAITSSRPVVRKVLERGQATQPDSAEARLKNNNYFYFRRKPAIVAGYETRSIAHGKILW
jgi:hypothetical protein